MVITKWILHKFKTIFYQPAESANSFDTVLRKGVQDLKAAIDIGSKAYKKA